MKKILLDICYREITKNEAGHLYEMQEGDALIKKINEMLIG